MYKLTKQPYAPPCVLQTQEVRLERGLLAGSIVNQIKPVETAGQETGDFFETDLSTSTFNHNWEE